ncbi:polysaccharide lyase family 3 protein [Aulographum hederae CBS 113979]|uniref:Pectate lyase n=1 Tax=Aulographum hederae CBS 113979 TaxID=1176131 RepID=A0A6G1GLQ6_9PEZI|nr:polysaccharide lyase family 3 protein [Aulographum hederae CBS 113979]
MSLAKVTLFLSFLGAAAAQSAPAPAAPLQTTFPTPKGTVNLSKVKVIAAGQSFDGGMKMYDRSPSTCVGLAALSGGDKEATFLLEQGASISNVILGKNGGEGIHCMGNCRITNVWWTDVCEDAATFKQKSGTSFIRGGGAKGAADKVFQHNGAGTIDIANFYAEDIGKLYRGCGNCNNPNERHVKMENVIIKGVNVAAGINANYGDTAIITNSCIQDGDICGLFTGVTKGQPKQYSKKPDGKSCIATNVRTTC